MVIDDRFCRVVLAGELGLEYSTTQRRIWWMRDPQNLMILAYLGGEQAESKVGFKFKIEETTNATFLIKKKTGP